MKKKTSFILTLGMILSAIAWLDWLVDIEQTRRNGDLIVHAIKNYREQNNALPKDLISLVPQYLKELPRVKREFMFLPDKNFSYSVHDVIPFSGCFILNFKHKADGRSYKFDSREGVFNFTGIRSPPEYIEENITFEDIDILSSAILSYYRDSLKYPAELKELTPGYMGSFPYDTSARYRPYDIAPNYSAELLKYDFYQPCDTFRGKFRLYFDVVFGRYYYNNISYNLPLNAGWSYDD